MHSLSRTCRQFWFLQRPSRSPSRYNAAKATPALKSELARDIRAVPITLLTVAKRDSESANAMVGEWLDKLRRYTTVKEVNVKPNPKQSPNPLIQMAAEGEKVAKAIDQGDWVVLLDERGRPVTSEDVARIIAAAGDRGTPLTFCIGGPFGHGEAVRKRGNECIRLSNLVLNHQVAHVVLAEQLYRGFTILRGEPYHH